MKKDFIGELAFGLVQFNGVLIPKRFKAILTDTTSTPGDSLPSIAITFEISQARLKCVAVNVSSGESDRPIKSTLLREINIDKLGIEAATSLALERKVPGDDALIPAAKVTGRGAAKKLADGVSQLSQVELMHIGYHYSNPANAKSPTQAVMKALNYGSRHTAIRRVKEARSLGWVLPEGSSAEQVAKHFENLRKRMDS